VKAKHAAVLLAIMIIPAGCERQDGGDFTPEIAVTNSYLDCAVRDICGNVGTMCLMTPGMCPGHFDISPAALRRLDSCRLLLRFDFQAGMDEQMKRLRENGLQIAQAKAMPGLCIGASYAATCQDALRALIEHFPERETEFQSRVNAIKERMAALDQELRRQVAEAGLANANVVCSVHQSEFAKSLGLNVVSVFPGGDIATPANLGECITKAEGKKIDFVIANEQEGTVLPKALAKRLNSKMVVFTNFPHTGQNFDDMVRNNVARITGGDSK